MDAIDATWANDTERAASPWEAEILRRWTHLQEVIAETDYDLAQSTVPHERAALEASFRLLKRAALSVWVDARRVGLALPAKSRNAG